MNHLREAAQQALEVLWFANAHHWFGSQTIENAISSLQTALAQQGQEQEPVAWMDEFGNAFPLGAVKGAGSWRDDHQRNWTPLFTHPPRREWRSLSEGEVASCWAKGFEACKDQTIGDLRMHIARAVEAALKEKNHE
jgi:hypothetical protein